MTKLTKETIEHGIRVFTAQQQDASMSVLLCEKMLKELQEQLDQLPKEENHAVQQLYCAGTQGHQGKLCEEDAQKQGDKGEKSK